jgi:hypothetical protein
MAKVAKELTFGTRLYSAASVVRVLHTEFYYFAKNKMVELTKYQ